MMDERRAPSEIGTVIVGGGIVGMCLAWFLAEEGHDVAVVDDGRHAGTIANAGGLHVQLQSRFMRLYPEMVPAFEETLPFYPRAVRHWQALAARLGEDIELAVTGGLMVAESREQYEFLEKKCRREQQLGLEVEMLDRAALDRIAPYFAAEHRRRRTVRHRGQGQSAAGQPGRSGARRWRRASCIARRRA